MKKKPYRKEFYSGITVTILLLGLILWMGSLKKQQDVDILLFGDSVIGINHTSVKIPELLEQKLGKTVYNAAFGGSSLSAGTTKSASYTEESISFVHLAEALCAGDFSTQESDLASSRDRVVNNENFLKILRGLKTVDLSQVSVIVIEHGVNDFNSERPLDNLENPYDICSFGGALRYSIEILQKNYPNIQIVLVSPAYFYLQKTDMDCYSIDYGYGTMEAYVDLEKEIAEVYGLPFIDMLHSLPIHLENIYVYTEDGMHLTEEGFKLYGDYLAQQLKEELQ
ncbi:MAG: SGNH/GDSL hydrolase family protein [Lachnospiraceae bacterium]|nr:SGNH/GDSL hydrolase family protein [Lachnospiraceae bacterium]